ncbi:MAG: glycosyltransferase [Thermodesulfobacteriota bacterium]
MKIVFNTRSPHAPASLFYADAFGAIDGISFFSHDCYEQCDIALFMSYEKDLADIVAARAKFPHLKIGLIDPRGEHVTRCLAAVDFLVVDSLEMKDYFARFQLPIFLYAEYPNVRRQVKVHAEKRPVVIGYHGNVVHLAGMYPHITLALEELARRYPIEFWAMYNLENAGQCRLGLPGNMPVRHIQWSMEHYETWLSQVDIGIAPSLMPIRNISRIKRKATLWKRFFNDTEDDYLTRYKMPSNPGRILVFGLLGIPVVADFYPSALQVIRDGSNGLLACSCGGWYRALESLVADWRLRQKLADAMAGMITAEFDYAIQNERFLAFLQMVVAGAFSSLQENTILPQARELGRDLPFWQGISSMMFFRLRKMISAAGRRMAARQGRMA